MRIKTLTRLKGPGPIETFATEQVDELERVSHRVAVYRGRRLLVDLHTGAHDRDWAKRVAAKEHRQCTTGL